MTYIRIAMFAFGIIALISAIVVMRRMTRDLSSFDNDSADDGEISVERLDIDEFLSWFEEKISGKFRRGAIVSLTDDEILRDYDGRYAKKLLSKSFFIQIVVDWQQNRIVSMRYVFYKHGDRKLIARLSNAKKIMYEELVSMRGRQTAASDEPDVTSKFAWRYADAAAK